MIAAAAYFTYGAALGVPGTAVTVAGQSMMIYGTGAYLGAAAAAGFVGGALATGSLKGALRGAFTAGLTAGVGGSEWFGGLSESAQTALDVGMAIASRSVTSHDRNVQQETAQATQIATAGGTMSSVTGGKFVSGAATESFSQVSNRTWSSYLPGVEAGDYAAQYWADIAVNSDHPLAPLAHVPGVFAALWTDQTAAQTAFTLGTAGTGAISSRAIDFFTKGYGFKVGRAEFWYKLPKLNGRTYFSYKFKNGTSIRLQRGNWGRENQPWYKQEYLKLPAKKINIGHGKGKQEWVKNTVTKQAILN